MQQFRQNPENPFTRKIVERLISLGYDINQNELLGEGNFGAAYTDGEIVVKLTRDLGEVENAKKIVGLKTKHIVHIYDVFLDGKIGVIVQEKLESLTEDEEKAFTFAIKSLPFGPILFPFAKGKWKKVTEQVAEKNLERAWIDVIGEDPDDRPEIANDLYNQYQTKSIRGLNLLESFQIPETLKELNEIGLGHYTDFKASNIGKRGSLFVIFDLSSETL